MYSINIVTLRFLSILNFSAQSALLLLMLTQQFRRIILNQSHVVNNGGDFLSYPGKLNLFKKRGYRGILIALIGMVVILCLFLASFRIFQNLILQSLSQMNIEFVAQVDTLSATLQNLIYNTAMQMFYSNSIKTLRTSSTLTNAQRTVGLRDLWSLVSSSAFISSAMIYNPSTDFIFTSEGDHPSDKSYLFHDTSVVDLLLSRNEHDTSTPIKRQTVHGECYSFIFYESKAPNSGALLLNVYADWYERQLLGISSGDNCVILTNKGEVIAAGNDTLATAAKDIWPTLYGDFLQDNGRGFYLESNGKTGWMYCYLNNLELYYLRSFNTATISPDMTRMKNSALIMLFVVCSLLVCSVLYSLFELYIPIRAVRKALKNTGDSKNEILQQVDELLEGQMEHRLSQKIELLLNGREDGTILYPIALILAETQDLRIVKSAVTYFARMQPLVAKIDFGCAVIVGEPNDEKLQEICMSISEIAECRCFWGHPRANAADLALSYQNLVELWQMRFLYAGQRIFSEKMITTCQNTPSFQPKEAAPLLAALRAGQLEDARAYWKVIYDTLRNRRFDDYNFCVGYILKSLIELQVELCIGSPLFHHEKVDYLNDINLLQHTFDIAFATIVTAQENRRKIKLNQLAAKINERIEARYFEDTLSVQNIADEMSMNPVYLGRLYRQCAGRSINEAINYTRVEKAKKRLRESSEPIESISIHVGFTNTKYFFVIFKNIVGVTPSKYRNQENA